MGAGVMKTTLKLLLVAIVINAAARAGLAAKSYFQFKEAAQQAVLFGAESTPEDIQQLILERADEFDIPIAADDVSVNRDGGRTWAEASYRERVEYFPNQTYPINWSFSVEAYSMVLGAPSTAPVKRPKSGE